MDLLERNDLADRMAAKLTAARTGRGSVVCLFGEAGAGKTAFTRLLASSFHVRTLWGACEDLATPEALGPLRDWAREAGHSALDGIPQAGRRIELFSEVLAALSSECTLAVIEDLHWADDATLDLVSFLGAGLKTSRWSCWSPPGTMIGRAAGCAASLLRSPRMSELPSTWLT